jgi:predicted transcriptional regulator
MTIADMVRVLHARVLCGEARIETPVFTACCSDLMGDVLAFVNEKTVLITGLTNPHVLRTADMLDLKCLVFARGKVPTDDILEGADELGMVVLHTKMTAFTACGLLYEAGLRGVPVPAEWHQGGSVS